MNDRFSRSRRSSWIMASFASPRASRCTGLRTGCCFSAIASRRRHPSTGTPLVQLNPVTGRSCIILSVMCPLNATTSIPDPQWQFLNLQRQALTGKGARSVNLQEFFQYVPIFYLGPLRDADDEFSARSQFWGRLLKAMQIPTRSRPSSKKTSISSTRTCSRQTHA